MDTMVIEDERKNQVVDEEDQETEMKGKRDKKKDRKRSKSRAKRAEEEEEEENLNNSVLKKQSNISRLAVVKINFLDLCLSTGLTQRMRTESKTTYQRTQTL